jgi:MFS family permease
MSQPKQKRAREEPPRMVNALVPRELLSWALTAVALGALEGGLLGVIVKNQFADVASPLAINLAVAVVAGAPSFSNLTSFLFARLAAGRDKILFLCRLMQLMGLCLFLMVLPTATPFGLILFTVCTVIGRVAWSGILTVRAAVWRANYTRRWRGHVTARIVQIASLLIAAFSALIGYTLDWNGEAYRLLFPLAGLGALAAARVFRRTRVRQHRRLLRSEEADQSGGGRQFSLQGALEVLRENGEFRNYMIGMMVFGSGNLMIVTLLVVLLNEHFNMGQMEQVMLTSSVPLFFLCFSIAHWAKLLAGRHIFGYRAIHSWTFVSAYVIYSIALLAHIPWLLWLGSALLGSALAGGHLGWNLGHNDFTDDTRSTLYMAIHVGLTGLRGLVMPLVGVAFYQYLQSVSPGSGIYSILLPLVLASLGSAWFVYLHLERTRRLSHSEPAA